MRSASCAGVWASAIIAAATSLELLPLVLVLTSATASLVVLLCMTPTPTSTSAAKDRNAAKSTFNQASTPTTANVRSNADSSGHESLGTFGIVLAFLTAR